jgi:cellulose synthase/poly-beta-1,6-N-acetylglucosamine synthase-like glycosyltransferase
MTTILRPLIDALLLLATLLLAMPSTVLFVELCAAALPRRRHAADRPDIAPAALAEDRLAVLMPAHDEAGGIRPVIAAVMAQLRTGDRLLVVADNCTDATAAVARAAGAEVVERSDAVRRGKGYALDHGVRWLGRDAPAVVVIVDADCIVAPGALQRLRGRCLTSARPVQALYLMHAPAGAALGQRIAAFAWIVKNRARPIGSARLGWPCQLMGTGMAFPWPLLRDAPLASGHIVEDMQLGLDLAAAGAAPLFCAEALVSSEFPVDRAAAATQRTRWEHGHLSVIADAGPRLLGRALARGDVRLVGMVLDLLVPPLAALVLMLVVAAVVTAGWWAIGGAAAPFAVAGAALALVASGLVLAWARYGRATVGWRELLGLPLYVAAKIPVYLRLFTKRQVEWVRTKRHDE